MSVYRTLIVMVLLFAIAALLQGDRERDAGKSEGDRFLAHVSIDKPIYRAGEHVYVRGVVLGANDRKPLAPDKQTAAMVQITGPKGEIVTSASTSIQDSVAGFEWIVPDDASGGQYTATISFPWTGFP